MLVTMSQTTKNAPFGTDDTPNLQMKIIGGKRVQVPVEPRMENEDWNSGFQQQWLSPTQGPPEASILTQPDWEAYGSGLYSGYSTREQQKRARKISSYTSPMGDRSHSFKHGIPSLNTKVFLPPIATQPSGSFACRHNVTFDSGESDISVSLEKQVSRQLNGFGAQKLKEMYIDLTTFDRELTGLIGEGQFSLIALRHNLPLKLSLLKIIFAKFVDVRDASRINYEKILQYLSDCSSQRFVPDSPKNHVELNQDLRLQEHSPKSKPRNVGEVEQTFNEFPAGTESHILPMRREEENKLVDLVLSQLSPAEILNLKELRTSLHELDQVHSGELPIHVVKTACIQSGLPLTGSIITKLLGRAETTGGRVDWRYFLQPLEESGKINLGSCREPDIPSPMPQTIKFDPSFPARSSIDPSPFLDTITETLAAPKILPWERSPLGRIGNSSLSSRKSQAIHIRPSSPPSTASSGDPRVTLPEGWDEREHHEGDETYVSPCYTEPWMDKFNKLAHALRTYHTNAPHALAKDEAERVTKNYNLIYGLGFSEKKIENAVHQSQFAGKEGSSREQISVDTLLELLEGKRRFII